MVQRHYLKTLPDDAQEEQHTEPNCQGSGQRLACASQCPSYGGNWYGSVGTITYDVISYVLRHRRRRQRDESDTEMLKTSKHTAEPLEKNSTALGPSSTPRPRGEMPRQRWDLCRLGWTNQETIQQNEAKLLAWVESVLEGEAKSRQTTTAMETRIDGLESQIKELRAQNVSEERVAGLESKVQEIQAQLTDNSQAEKDEMADLAPVLEDMKDQLRRAQSQETVSSWTNWYTILACAFVIGVGGAAMESLPLKQCQT
ncbi:hypothetical protein QBC36DRAFT_356410 [Triangularia setosa]|uniref:Uncharacterized protein n=1 Tax=Triangularia setosa TaxID=2587417 RepID=A0AAN6W3P3_9PEZI|nr:hypothetical protein QBC36DRAFT_356410 [Podospora setosa]